MKHTKVITTYSGGVNKKIDKKEMEGPKIEVVKKKTLKIEEYKPKKK